jgi:hypothetical protein
MLSKLTRILLALVTAFVFTGQMEAAAQHCARLAQEAAAAPADDAPPCHETADAAASHHGEQPAPTHHTGGDAAAPDVCQCIAALKICVDLEGSTASSHVEPYAWLAPGEARFVSATPDPDLRPPRA